MEGRQPFFRRNLDGPSDFGGGVGTDAFIATPRRLDLRETPRSVEEEMVEEAGERVREASAKSISVASKSIVTTSVKPREKGKSE